MFQFEVGKTYYDNEITGCGWDAYQSSTPITITRKSAKSIWYSKNNQPVRCSRLSVDKDGNEYFKSDHDYIFCKYLDDEPVEVGFLGHIL